MQSHHSPVLVIVSVVIACLAGYIALHLASHVTSPRRRFFWAMGSAVAMGFGIWSMHFIAMLALKLPVRIDYELVTVFMSLAIAVAASYLGLSSAAQSSFSQKELFFTSIIMGGAIAGMHYTGMASIRGPISIRYDAVLVVASILIAISASFVALVLFRKFRHSPGPNALTLKIAAGIVMGFAISGMHYTAMAAAHFTSGRSNVAGKYFVPGRGMVAGVVALTLVIFALAIAAVVIDRWMETNRIARESAENLRLLINGVKDYAIFTIDPTGIIRTWNRGAERLLGYRENEIVGRDFRVLLAPENRDAALETLQTRKQAEAEAFDICLRKDGSRFEAVIATNPVYDDAGNLTGHARIIRDITERSRSRKELKRSEEQLKQSQKLEAIGLLAGGVAHDFNNVLGAINANAELLLLERKNDPEVQEGLREITRAVESATAMIRQLLAFSRKQVLEFTLLDPNQVIRGMEEILRRLLVGDIQLETHLADQTGFVLADPAQFEQVILNLVVNARDAMPEGGEVCISTCKLEVEGDPPLAAPNLPDGEYVCLQVSDEGVGIPSDARSRIFEPFYTTKPLGKGTGLGLSTVYGIVQQSGGHIWVEDRLGGGTSFYVCFPARQSERTEEYPIPSPKSGVGSGTILLVDDEKQLRTALNRVLTRKGYTVLEAGSGAEAVAIAERYPQRIDLMLCDVRMPGMNGPEAAAQVKRSCPDTRVVFMSGYADGPLAMNGSANDPLIQKPFTMDALVTEIEAALRGRRAGVPHSAARKAS